MKLNKNQQAFFDLLKAGLWTKTDQELKVHEFKDVDWEKVCQLAKEQSVQGLVLKGLECFVGHGVINNADIPLELLMQWIGDVQMIEQQNRSMNEFVAKLIETLREKEVNALLVKGQGIAQCYECPLWRNYGDVDLLLSAENYEKACAVLDKNSGKAERVSARNAERKHKEYHIDGWIVELHGTLHTNLSWRIDKEIDKVQRDVFCDGITRPWKIGETQVLLPRADEDVVFVFAHILQHLFGEGIGLRQICDWCRLLWTYYSKLNLRFLELRLRRMGLMTEWKAFASLAVEYLGMPIEAMPFYDSRFMVKGSKILKFVLKCGNFGHNRRGEWDDPFKRRMMLIRHRITDTIRLSFVFPVDAPKFLLNYAWDRFRWLVNRKNV